MAILNVRKISIGDSPGEGISAGPGGFMRGKLSPELFHWTSPPLFFSNIKKCYFLYTLCHFITVVFSQICEKQLNIEISL